MDSLINMHLAKVVKVILVMLNHFSLNIVQMVKRLKVKESRNFSMTWKLTWKIQSPYLLASTCKPRVKEYTQSKNSQKDAPELVLTQLINGKKWYLILRRASKVTRLCSSKSMISLSTSHRNQAWKILMQIMLSPFGQFSLKINVNS